MAVVLTIDEGVTVPERVWVRVFVDDEVMLPDDVDDELSTPVSLDVGVVAGVGVNEVERVGVMAGVGAMLLVDVAVVLTIDEGVTVPELV